MFRNLVRIVKDSEICVRIRHQQSSSRRIINPQAGTVLILTNDRFACIHGPTVSPMHHVHIHQWLIAHCLPFIPVRHRTIYQHVLIRFQPITLICWGGRSMPTAYVTICSLLILRKLQISDVAWIQVPALFAGISHYELNGRRATNRRQSKCLPPGTTDTKHNRGTKVLSMERFLRLLLVCFILTETQGIRPLCRWYIVDFLS